MVFLSAHPIFALSNSERRMVRLTQEDLARALDERVFHLIGETADELGMPCYVVGGWVRDLFLERPSTDIDVVVVGSGITLAEALKKRCGRGAHVSVFRNFGTAQLKWHGREIEFVGARKESYSHDSPTYSCRPKQSRMMNGLSPCNIEPVPESAIPMSLCS